MTEVTLPSVSSEEIVTLRAQVQSLQDLLLQKQIHADRMAHENRELQTEVKLERQFRQEAEAKLQDIQRSLYGCHVRHYW